MTPPAGGKYFSTSTPRPWQYATGAALRIAGPRLLKKKEHTRVGLSNRGTQDAPVPLALRFCPPPSIELPDLSKSTTAREQLAEMVAPIPPTEQQSTMRTEIDVIRRAGPYFHMVAEALAPHVLAHYGYNGVLEWRSEVPMTGSRPDIILSYNGRNALVLDFKAPNCIREAELRSLGASSVGSALSKLPTPDESSLLELARQDERALVLQGLKYAEKTRAPFIVFYDYDYFFAMEPTPELINRRPNVLLDVVLFREAAKSTRSQLVNLHDNHVSILLRYVLRAVARVAS